MSSILNLIWYVQCHGKSLEMRYLVGLWPLWPRLEAKVRVPLLWILKYCSFTLFILYYDFVMILLILRNDGMIFIIGKMNWNYGLMCICWFNAMIGNFLAVYLMFQILDCSQYNCYAAKFLLEILMICIIMYKCIRLGELCHGYEILSKNNIWLSNPHFSN